MTLTAWERKALRVFGGWETIHGLTGDPNHNEGGTSARETIDGERVAFVYNRSRILANGHAITWARVAEYGRTLPADLQARLLEHRRETTRRAVACHNGPNLSPRQPYWMLCYAQAWRSGSLDWFMRLRDERTALLDEALLTADEPDDLLGLLELMGASA